MHIATRMISVSSLYKFGNGAASCKALQVESIHDQELIGFFKYGNSPYFPLIKKILFIASHRSDRAPGQRFRFEQYFEYLGEHGFQCDLSFLLDEKDDKILYSKGNYHLKADILRRNYLKRSADLRRTKDYDVVFIFREALMTRSTYFEMKFARTGAKIIYDFDDAIWMNDTSAANKFFSWMKNPSKIAKSIAVSDLVFAGNAYLKDYASRFNENVVVVPTTIDTDEYRRIPRISNDEAIVIGWSGSITTIKHFEYAIPFLKILKKDYGDKVRIKVIGDANYRNEELNIVGLGWNRKDEVMELSDIDIGIMPLPDDPWARGKCGLKGLQYMALSIPTIMSPVGVNTEIIQDGVNGFLAGNTEEWIQKISRLIEEPALRVSMGEAARNTVEVKFSVRANKELYLRLFQSLF